MSRALFIVLVLLLCCASLPLMAAPVQHPNLLLNKQEIEQIKTKIRQYPWAADLFQRVKKLADDGPAVQRMAMQQNVREQALVYVLTGDKSYANKAKAALLSEARRELPMFEPQDPNADKTYGYNSWQNGWDCYAWVYDLIYDTCTDEERQTLERWLHDAGHAVMIGTKYNGTTPNLMFVMHYNAGIVGYCLGDQELIDFALNDTKYGPRSGGFYPVMDTMIRDKLFWGESPLYLLNVDLAGMFALAEAALHYDGTDLYHYVSPKSGASLKGLLDGNLRLGFPREETGIPEYSLRIASYGDGETGYRPQGTMRDLYLTDGDFLSPLEMGYKRFKDPNYAWVISQNPDRDADTFYQRAPILGLIALTHGEPLPENPTPPPAPCGIYPEQGVAMLRADETPTYWTKDSLAAMVRLGAGVGHGHPDYFGLVLHGKGRLLYPDTQFWQYEGTYLGWGREGIGHSTLLVDAQSPRPGATTTRQDFNPEAKFLAVSGSVFKGIDQTRRLLMTKEYLADVFHAAAPAGETHTFDWVLHGLGRLYPGNPGAYRPSNDLLAQYWWVENERDRTVNTTWQADWIQRSAGVSPSQGFGKEWFDHEAGVRMTMLGVDATRACYGDGPLVDGPPYGLIEGNPEGSVPMIVARREANAVTFAAVHEPYEGAPRIKQISRLAETPEAVAMAITAPDYTDYVMTAFDTQPHTLRTTAGEAFTFTDYGYLRFAGDKVIARGTVTGLRLNAKTLGKATVITLNGKQVSLRRQGEFLQWGDTPDAAASTVAKDDPIEQAASLQYYWLPAEVHLSAAKPNDEREVEMHLRATGGDVQGTLQVSVQPGLIVEPAQIDIAPLPEGQERVIKFKVRATDKAENALYQIFFAPAGKLLAPRQMLTASVGVVTTVDRHFPDKMQHVIRAPGYTMKVDYRSGSSYYLLDADGNRRFGPVHDANFCFGFPSVGNVQYNGKPVDGVWTGKNSLQIIANPRIQYTFDEDRITITLTRAEDPSKPLDMWLGNFDALDKPVHNGTWDQSWLPINADKFFFPHPVFRQGVYLTTPPKTPVMYRWTALNFPIKQGQSITLQFATPEEAAALMK